MPFLAMPRWYIISRVMRHQLLWHINAENVVFKSVSQQICPKNCYMDISGWSQVNCTISLSGEGRLPGRCCHRLRQRERQTTGSAPMMMVVVVVMEPPAAAAATAASERKTNNRLVTCALRLRELEGGGKEGPCACAWRCPLAAWGRHGGRHSLLYR